MSKQCVLLSIRPQYCELIANGKKTVDVRKTRPKLETPFKCYIYCTSVKSINLGKYCSIHAKTGGAVDDWSGRVIGEFVCDRINMLAPLNHCDANVEKDSCLTREQIVRYLRGKGYGWHISALKIYDKPKELSEFASGGSRLTFSADGESWVWSGMKRPPQSWCYVEGVYGKR